MGIAGGVVEGAGGLEAGPGREGLRLAEVIGRLPVVVPLRHPEDEDRLLLAREPRLHLDPTGELVDVRHDPHEIGLLPDRPTPFDAEVGDAGRHHGEVAGNVDHVHHPGCRLLGEPEGHPARVALRLAGADVVHLREEVAAGGNRHRRAGRGHRRPHPGNVSADERRPRLAVVPRGRDAEADAVHVPESAPLVVGMTEAIPSAELRHRLLHLPPGEVAQERVVHDATVAGEELERAEVQVLVAIQPEDEVAVEIPAVGADLRRLLEVEHDVGGAEILLERRVVGERRERGGVGGIALRLAGLHPGLEHRDLTVRRPLRRRVLQVAHDLRRRHAPGLDLLDAQLDPVDGVVVAEQRKRPGLAGSVAQLAVGVEERQHVAVEGRGAGGGRSGRIRSLRPVERTAGGLGSRHTDGAAGEQVLDGVCEFRLGVARRHHAADLVAVVDPAGVADPPLAVDEHRLGRGGGPESPGQFESRVEMDREPDAVGGAVAVDLRGIVALADHADEADAPAGEVGGQRLEHRSVGLGERAGGMEEGEADGLAVAEQVVEGVRHPVEPRHGETLRRRHALWADRRVGGESRDAHEQTDEDAGQGPPQRAIDAGGSRHPVHARGERGFQRIRSAGRAPAGPEATLPGCSGSPGKC